jgi:anaerobic selenocysteine-containing dehydrogenase
VHWVLATTTRRWLQALSRGLDKILIVVDLRRSETAHPADIHLAIRPGRDTPLARSMIAIILQESWEKWDYIERHTMG